MPDPAFIADARLPAQLRADAVRQALWPTLTGVYRGFTIPRRLHVPNRDSDPDIQQRTGRSFA